MGGGAWTVGLICRLMGIERLLKRATYTRVFRMTHSTQPHRQHSVALPREHRHQVHTLVSTRIRRSSFWDELFANKDRPQPITRETRQATSIVTVCNFADPRDGLT